MLVTVPSKVSDDGRVSTYSQDSQQRRFSGILQTNHGHLHLESPIVPCQQQNDCRRQPRARVGSLQVQHVTEEKPRIPASSISADLPEGPQQPVVNLAKESGHGVSRSRLRSACGKGGRVVNGWVDRLGARKREGRDPRRSEYRKSWNQRGESSDDVAGRGCLVKRTGRDDVTKRCTLGLEALSGRVCGAATEAREGTNAQ